MRMTFCVACGELEHLEHHHLVPLAEGGGNEETNLITLCPACHGKVHGYIRRPLGEIRRKRREAVRAELAAYTGQGQLRILKPARYRKPVTITRQRMKAWAEEMVFVLAEIRAEGHTTLAPMAEALNARQVRRAKGGAWCSATLRRALIVIGEHLPEHPYVPNPRGFQITPKG